MSVLIKGMKIPENCEECPIREGTFCDIINKDIDLFYSGSIKRDPDCPLVDLGKHGDLIDRDEVRNAVFHHLGIKREENLLPVEKSVYGNIIKAEAVIEAEGER